MTNQPAERLPAFYAYRERDLRGPVPPRSDPHPRLDYDRAPKMVVLLDDALAALAAERKAGADEERERIRAALLMHPWLGSVNRRDLLDALAILDAEAQP